VREVSRKKFYVTLLVLALSIGILSFSYATFTYDSVIKNTGRTYTIVMAKSGSAVDIQAAVDQVAVMGGGEVHIPEGTFNFYEPGQTWKPVVIPAGISIFGAPTERTSGLPIPDRGMNPNDQVISWRTVLVMPYEVPTNDIAWFRIEGNSDPTKPTRISDIKFVGYREIDPNSTKYYHAIDILNVVNFRVDHCYFKNVAGSGVWISGDPNMPSCGVIDHNRFENDLGVPRPYENRTLGYGVGIRRVGSTWWEPDIDKVVGHYNNYTVFIEDNYFYRWRHCISSNDGVHYVARYNTVGEGNYGNANFDAHGAYDYVGTRAVEIYNNEFESPVYDYQQQPFPIFIRGGGGCIFNNTVAEGYYLFVYLRNDDPNNEQSKVRDLWIWNNDIDGIPESRRVVAYGDVNYTLAPKPNYIPYPYPHPLTLQRIPSRPQPLSSRLTSFPFTLMEASLSEARLTQSSLKLKNYFKKCRPVFQMI
jgi:hypothetical protein